MVKIIKLENSKEYSDKKIVKVSDTNGQFKETWFDNVSKKEATSIVARLATGRNHG